jgi:hypothetical protein
MILKKRPCRKTLGRATKREEPRENNEKKRTQMIGKRDHERG